MKKKIYLLLILSMVFGCSSSRIDSEKKDENEQEFIDVEHIGDKEKDFIRVLPEDYSITVVPESEYKQYFYTTEIIKRENTKFIDENIWKYNSNNDFLNWISNFDALNEKREHLHLDLLGNDADRLNQYFDDFFNLELGDFVCQTIAGWSEISNDLISIVIRTRYFSSDGFYKSQNLETYTFDLNDQVQVTNRQLLEKYGLTFEQAQNIVDNHLKMENILLCEEGVENICYYKNFNMQWLSNNLSSVVAEDSILFIDENGHLNMLIYVDYKNLNENSLTNEEISNFYVIQLIE